MKKIVCLLAFLGFTAALQAAQPEHLWLGADISATTSDEARGVESEKPGEGEAFMDELFDAVINNADGACTGVFYWAPECFVTYDFKGNPQGYALGAFQRGRPTSIMNAFTRAAYRR